MGRWNSEKAEADTHRWENLGAIWMEKKAADDARDREIRELKQLIECLYEQTKANIEMVRQLIEATKDNQEGPEAVNSIRGRISTTEQIQNRSRNQRRRSAKSSERADAGLPEREAAAQ